SVSLRETRGLRERDTVTTNQSAEAPRPRSLIVLLVLTLFDLLVALLLAFGFVLLQASLTSPSTTWGTLKALQAAGVPLDKLGLQERLDREMTWRYLVAARCVSVPPDDAELQAFLREQSDLGPLTIEHVKLTPSVQNGETVRVQVRYFGPAGMRRLEVPWEKC